MRFPPSFIERLRDIALMSDVVGARIPLKQFGREYKACCPFHKEKTPSFTVNNEKNFYHCFGCGAHGDAIEFVRKYENLSYPESIERLAHEVGLPLPELSAQEEKQARVEKTLHDVCEAACVWFEQQLAASSGGIARDYLEKRGLRPQTIRQFRIGYAPDEPRLLHQHLKKNGYDDKLQQEAGLISNRDGRSIYDRFRGRVIFPIRNGRGKVVAFGGRLLQAANNPNLPKYLNSPETPLFKKGELLFNMDLAKSPARKDNMAVVMEGYTDVVAAWQAGILYGVATLGTAVTPMHLQLLWKLAKEPVICLDGDEAGQRAMQKAIDICLPQLAAGRSLRFAVLPVGEDPDSYINEHGKQGFERVLASSKRLSQTIWEYHQKNYTLDLPEGRAALDDTLKSLCEKIPDSNVRQHYSSYFKSKLWERSGTGKNRAKGQGLTRSSHVERMAAQSKAATLDNLTRAMLELLLGCPALLHNDNREEFLAKLDISDIRMAALRDTMLAAAEEVDTHDRSAFLSCIKSRLPEEVLTSVCKKPTAYQQNGAIDEQDARQRWRQTQSAHETAHLEYELQQLQENLGNSMDESTLSRLVEVQNALRQTRQRSHMPAEEEDLV